MQNITTKLYILIIFLIAGINAKAQIRMWGTVYTDRGKTVTGALVEVENTNYMTLTNTNGEYLITAKEQYKGHPVIISYSGYKNDTILLSPGPHDVMLSNKESIRITSQIISTQRRGNGELELDVPMALTIVNAKKQENFNLMQIDEMSQQVPGLICMVPSSDWGIFGIRGVGTEGIYAFERQRISIYKDGVSMTRPRCNVVELFDMDRVEVIKGPQSTLFGKGAEFGAVHYITNQPKDTFELSAGAGTGRYGQRYGDFMVNTPIPGGKLASRTALHYNYHDGYKNNKAGGRLDGKNAMAAKQAITYFQNENTQHTLQLNYEYDAEPAIGYKNTKIPTPGGTTSPFTDARLTDEGPGQNIRRHIYSASITSDVQLNPNLKLSNIVSYVGFDSKNGYDLDGSHLNLINTRYHTKGKSISEEARLSWNDNSRINGFVSISGSYDEYKVSSRDYGDFHLFTGMVASQQIKSNMRDLPNEVVLKLKELIDMQCMMIKANVPPELQNIVDIYSNGLKGGLNTSVASRIQKKMDTWFSNQKWTKTPDFINDIRYELQACMTEELTRMMTNPEIAPVIEMILNGMTIEEYYSTLDPLIDQELAEIKELSNIPLAQFMEENEKHYNKVYEADIFGDMTWNIWASRLFVTAGLRGTCEHQKAGYSSTSDKFPIFGNIMFAPTENGKTVTAQDTYWTCSGRGVINFKVDTTHNLFYSLSLGHSTGDLHFEQGPDNLQSLKPERILNNEIGFKGQSKYGRFYYYIAFFHYMWTKFQSSVYTTGEDGKLLLLQNTDGKARGLGIDGQLLYTFNKEISSYLNLSVCDGKFTNTDIKGKRQELAGNSFIMLPKTTVDYGLNFNYRIRTWKDKYVLFYPSMSYMTKMYFTSDNDESLSQKGFWLANANLGFAWQSRNSKIKYQVSLYGKNLMNTKYLISAGNAGQWLGLPTFVTGAPLTAGVIFRMKM